MYNRIIALIFLSLVCCFLKIPSYDPQTMIYFATGYDGIELYIPQSKLIENSKPVNLKDLFEKNHISLLTPRFWNWATAENTLMGRAKKEKQESMILLDELPKILNDAKSTLKSFLLKDDNLLPEIEKTYIKKYGINRLFTYTKIQKIIDEKKLMYVRLPKKILTVKDREVNRYVSSKEALGIIDEIVQWYALSSQDASLTITDKSNKYEFVIFASKESISGRGLSGRAKQELEIICQEAPFDVGFDNIFWDSRGLAIIIDTENKHSSEDVCKNKLDRYPIDGSLPGRIKQPKVK